MTRLQVDIPDEVAKRLRRRAEALGLSISEYLGELVDADAEDEWPEAFFEEVAGGWRGTNLERPDQGELEERADF